MEQQTPREATIEGITEGIANLPSAHTETQCEKPTQHNKFAHGVPVETYDILDPCANQLGLPDDEYAYIMAASKAKQRAHGDSRRGGHPSGSSHGSGSRSEVPTKTPNIQCMIKYTTF